jgi:hypothetical protein
MHISLFVVVKILWVVKISYNSDHNDDIQAQTQEFEDCRQITLRLFISDGTSLVNFRINFSFKLLRYNLFVQLYQCHIYQRCRGSLLRL